MTMLSHRALLGAKDYFDSQDSIRRIPVGSRIRNSLQHLKSLEKQRLFRGHLCLVGRTPSEVAIILIGGSRANSNLAVGHPEISGSALSHQSLASISKSTPLLGEGRSCRQ
jgi:hypothetical protein